MKTDLETLEEVAAARKTIKVMADGEFPLTNDHALIERLLAVAGRSPFHKACHATHRESGLNGIEPWRFYVLDSAQCRRLRRVLQSMEGSGKIPAMLSAARALILSTWLPNPASQAVDQAHHEWFEPTLDNVEHIAATAAALQSLLLAATAAGIANYWSSGGILRLPQLFDRLSIPRSERLLGAVFLFPNELPEGVPSEVATSKLREQRCASSQWSRVVELTD